jgi:hypothetical protein
MTAWRYQQLRRQTGRGRLAGGGGLQVELEVADAGCFCVAVNTDGAQHLQALQMDVAATPGVLEVLFFSMQG